MKVVMPQIGMTMVAGVIDIWRVSDGDVVKKGDIIVDISTEKLLNEIEAPVSGTIKLLAQEGDTIECGNPIADIKE